MSKRFLAIFAIITITMFFAGCPKKQTVVSESAMASSEAKEEAVAKAQAEAAEKARVEAEVAGKEAEETAKMEAEEQAKAEAIKAFQAKDIHFDFDSYDIKEIYRENLNDLADWLLRNKDVSILIEGHADERGNNEYNLALGDRRAHSVMQYLTMLGVASERISAITYGEEKPLCAEPTEDCWWKNRRVHFSIQQG